MTDKDFDKSKRIFLKKCLALSAGIVALPQSSVIKAITNENQKAFGKIAMFQEETAQRYNVQNLSK